LLGTIDLNLAEPVAVLVPENVNAFHCLISSCPAGPGGSSNTDHASTIGGRQVLPTALFIEVLILETDAGEMPAIRAISRTPLPAVRNFLAFSTFGLVSGGRPNLIDRLLAAA
jgi:hypothetical protein